MNEMAMYLAMDLTNLLKSLGTMNEMAMYLAIVGK